MDSVGSELNTPHSDGEVLTYKNTQSVDSNTRQSSATPVSVTGSNNNINAATTTTTTTAGGRVRKKKVACVECRQQKSKCDAHDKAPEPCTRCQKKGVPCVLKRDFRRTYKRARNEAIEKRFKELTATLSNLSSEEILKRIEEEQQQLLDNSNFTKDKIKRMKDENMKKWKNEDLQTAKNSNVSGSFEEEFEQFTPNLNGNMKSESIEIAYPKFTEEYVFKEMTEEQLLCSPKSLGDIYVSSSEIAELFQEFATKYHRFLPVVDLTKGAERIYNLSPCLFWVILLIGLRRKAGATSLMKRLSVLVKSVLSEITISPIIRYTPSDKDDPVLNVASVYSVQAFLLYTFWPPLTSSLSADTSWNTIGTAMFQAIRVGLNCADFSKEYVTANSELINEQIRTWVCCNIVSQLIASSFGFPAFTSFDHSIINSTKITNLTAVDQNIPLPLKQLTHIARFENQVSNTISSNGTNVVGIVERESKHPLIQILNQQLAHLELALEDTKIDDIRRFSLLVAKTHLLMYYFNDPLLSENSNGTAYKETFSVNKTEALFETKKGLIKTYNAAVDFLGHAHTMWKYNPTVIKYLPGVFVLNIWQSACIISKLANSSIAPLLDVARGKKAYQNAVLLTYSASVLKHDMAYRSSGIMKSIWSLYANMYESWRKDQHGREGISSDITADFNLGITVRSRMAVSIFFDCLYILKEKCGMAKLEREARSNNGVEDSVDEKNDDDDEFEANLNGNGVQNERSTDLQNIKDPEGKARRIIETIPLDPNPINAASSSSNGSSINTPNSNANEAIPTNSMLNKISPENANTNSRSLNNSPLVQSDKTTTEYRKSLIKPPETSMFDIVRNQKPQFNNNYRSIIRGENTERAYHNSNSPSQMSPNGQNPNRISSLQADTQSNQYIVPLSEDQINTTPTNDSPNSIMANWDNWESDMVWKDVDILMNEFAFNPTL